MSDDRMYIVHKKAGLARPIAKMMGNNWISSGVTEAFNEFMEYLLGHYDAKVKPTKEECDAYWAGYFSGKDEFTLVQEDTFNKTWTTPSGFLWQKSDFVNPGPEEGDFGEPLIFRMKFL